MHNMCLKVFRFLLYTIILYNIFYFSTLILLKILSLVDNFIKIDKSCSEKF